mmetsp:Transcript_71731/g.181226  ORF Transcript_71731/g.181226 Transcript_71731/m.181226 type:complete len:272 (-) Transcript_71731:411-1226(-)
MALFPVVLLTLAVVHPGAAAPALRGNASSQSGVQRGVQVPDAGLQRARIGRSLTFVNSCPEPLAVTGSEDAYTRLAPGASHVMDIGQMGSTNMRFTPYFLPGDSYLCPEDACSGWRVTNPGRGSQWIGGMNPHYAAVCNPDLSGRAGVVGCCSKESPEYNAATGNCPNINNGGWGSLFEVSFDAWGGLDFLDFSTNFVNPDQGYVFFNIPMSLTSLASCSNGGSLRWQCLAADCNTAYQSPEDTEHNGAQLSCPSSASYRIEYCPGGMMPF